MIVQTLENHHIPELLDFCKACELRGFYNNSSLEAMKYQWCKDWGEYWGAWHDQNLIAVAGAHPLPEIGVDAVRVLFRTCQLQSFYRGLDPMGINTVPFRDILFYQVKKYSNKDLYITTNIDHDASGKMSRIHRVMKTLECNGIVSLHREEIMLYYTNQSVWKLNKETYLETRYRLETSKKN